MMIIFEHLETKVSVTYICHIFTRDMAEKQYKYS